MPTPCSTEPSKLKSNGFSAFKTKQRDGCLSAFGTRVHHTFYVPFTGYQSRTESSTTSCCMFINLLITRLQSTPLTFSNCTMLSTALNTVDVDYAPLLMPLDLPYLVRSVILGAIRSMCAVLDFGIGFNWASEKRRPSLVSKSQLKTHFISQVLIFLIMCLCIYSLYFVFVCTVLFSL